MLGGAVRFAGKWDLNILDRNAAFGYVKEFFEVNKIEKGVENRRHQ